MFCPLCKAEFRQGFAICSDCNVSLVATSEEAAAVGVERLWTGDNRERMERILDALADAEISFHSKELLKHSIWPWVSMLLWRFMKPRPTYEFHIDVLQKDMARAEGIVGTIEQEEGADFDDDENEEPVSAPRQFPK
jgi:hypothetical protein